MGPQDLNLEHLENRLRSIELRLERLESDLTFFKSSQAPEESEEFPVQEPFVLAQQTNDDDKGLEGRIGRVGLAWIGNIVLLFAVLFITEQLMTGGHRLFSFCVGICSFSSVLLIAWYFRKSNPNLSLMLRVNSQIILFYEVMRLYFFSSQPLIANKFIVLFVLLIVIGLQIYIALRNNSQVFGFISIIFFLITAIITESTHLLLPLLTATSILAVYYFFRMRWQFLIVSTILLVYIAFFFWLFGNPLMDHEMQILSENSYGHLYLFLIGACFSILPLFYKTDESLNDLLIGTIILNGILFTLLLIFISTKYFSSNYVILFSIISASCLLYSVFLKSVSKWKYSSAFYALYGFLAMSITLYGMVGIPKVYLLLSVQSFVVVIWALWFRNRLIIVMNSFLFLSILLIYLLSSKPVDGVNFSFALVPLVSARIINWQKDRLDIKTDFIRNLYLSVAFFLVLFALYHGLPKQFISLSWTMAALLYFLVSILLKNIKYRYMALGTMICAAIYLMFVDLASIEIIYRILALLFLAVVSIGISIYYNRRMNKSE